MRALLSGYYGKGNGGDEALLATLLQMLPSHVTPVVLSGNPEETSDRYGVESHNRMSLTSVLPALRSCDAFIWGGGSLIQDVTSSISPFYYGGLMALAQKMGLKTVAWAQGIGPLVRPQTRWLAQHNFSGCTTVSVRDRVSAALLADWQIPYILAPDPVWALQAKPFPELANLPTPRIAVTLRNHPQLTAPRLANLTQALVSLQKSTQAFILLLPFQKSEDLAIAQAIQPQLKDVSEIVCIEDPQILKGVFRGVEMAIGMRLHSLIMAASEGCRCFALSYDPKINRLMEDLAIPGWDLANLPDNANVISKTWIDFYTNAQPLASEKITTLVEGAFMHRELLRKALGRIN
ncbi:Polysaccharide pyruvyl transferase [Trichormus variabilis ATCC 29413]|uniref:Polysaccharide pyruvyl transferase n=2 Tax=Anabaena variabilis TaxID=264691 RepID=Q3M7Q4_TRIV2|nr:MULTISPECIES: polysaccharide pyruvyl transferase CsaB [Nostocaceae]ABA22982.1 Polysaccharide pyruvyl transferase [Trichormus variabilis ATCC 29413]MBC1216228.1 polysaccharide pyruvyl transferase CsaB [Trichormus variabilis ARAD]MBC1257877.1 polysaccharide pyruvyl transferase CsaB [Trichormus variabilis V5]MBC1266427.1 polysaccharide pyruvyl transferase CsaB [Trichormus variabilis FSR]MBC1302617.1 polysaccharide pyruvyl transferase CsaB [Trichormus variabilis N2B]